jgi:regulator of RNase E activity RraA
MDLYPKALLLRPIFRDFGGKRRFFGRVRTLRVFEDNALVRKVLEEGQGRGLVDAPVAFAGARILPSWFLVADEDGILLLPEPPSGGQSGG